MKFILVGAVEGSAVALESFIACGLIPALVCTLPPQLANRHSDYADLRPIADRYNIPIRYIDNINNQDVLQELNDLALDYIFVIGWSQLLKRELLQIPKMGCVGFHPAPLPQFRGRAAIPWTILLGANHSGSTLFYLDLGADSGRIIAQELYPVSANETARSLYDKCLHSIEKIITGIAPTMQQDLLLPSYVQDESQASYLAKRTPVDGWIDWGASAQRIWTLVRAVSKPYPGAFTLFHDKKLVIWSAEVRTQFNQFGVPGQILSANSTSVTVQCGTDWLDVELVQEEGQAEMEAARYFTRMHDRLGITMYDLWRKLSQATE